MCHTRTDCIIAHTQHSFFNDWPKIIDSCEIVMACDGRINWLFRNELQWRHNGHIGVSNHQPHDCLLNRLLGRRSKKISKLRVTGFCAGNSPVTGEFPAQMVSNAENVSVWWRHHGRCLLQDFVKLTLWNFYMQLITLPCLVRAMTKN